MALPPFEEGGDLPAGIHAATLRDVIERFGTTSERRRVMAARLTRAYAVAAATGSLGRFIVFGSFATAKPAPNDIDVFLLMENSFDVSSLTGVERLLFDHGAADAYFGGSVFWMRRLGALGGEEAAIADWQITREGRFRGIVEVVTEDP